MEKRKNTKNFKERGCEKLVSLNKKKITPFDIAKVAKDLPISEKSLERAWQTFQETGGRQVDYRCSTGSGTIKMVPTIHSNCKKRKSITAAEAGSIIIEYMKDSKINSRELSNKHKISLNQFYEWIKELNVSGTLLGKKVLDPKKYAKLNVLDVIWFKKRPSTKRKSISNLSLLEKHALTRVANVLENYLPRVGK